MTFDIQESEKQDLEMKDGESFVTDSSLMFEKTKMLEFNSALDIFSEIVWHIQFLFWHNR